MAVQTTEEYKNGGATTYSITIEYLKASDIKVRIDGALQTYVASSPSSGEYTVSGTTVTLGAQAAAGSGNVHIYRETDVNTAAAVFAAGSSIRAADLNAIHDMARFSAVEHRNQVISADIKDGQVTTSKIAADNITSALIADDQINSEHYAADSIDSEHYAPGSVDSAAIGASQVTTNELATDSVNTTKIIDLNVTRAKLEADAIDSTKLADNAVNSEHYVDGSIDHVHLANDIIDGDNIQDDVINSEHIAAGALDNEHYAAGSITSDKLNGATVVTASEQAAAASNDTSFLTTAAADARFFNVSTGDTIKDGDSFPDNDTTIATTAAINDRIIDLVDDVGGFVPIANETSFPTANPDVNNGTGTIVSVKAASTNLAPSGTTVTIANGAGTGNTVTITGVSATIPSGFGFLVETTSTLHTYTFHRLSVKATEVTTVAGISSNVTTVAGIASDVTSVAGISSNVTSVAGNATNINAVAGNASNINAVAADASDIGVVAADGTDIGLVAGSISNVNNVGGSIASVNTAAANLTSIANFGDQYQVASSNPSTDGGGNALAEGDLYFNTTANELKIYNGGQWQGGVTASGNFAATTGNTFTGDNVYADNAKLKLGTGSDLEIFHNANDSIINDAGQGTLKVQSGGNTKLEVTGSGAALTGNLDVSSGLDVTGNITVTGNVDGRDLATDGTKLDGIEAGAEVNPTNAEIRTAVEAATDSNVFTDADHTKLNGIETGAKDDQTAAEIKTLLNSDGIVNSNVDAAAAIAGTKIAPSFGAQDIVGQKLEIAHATPTIELNDADSNDWSIINNNGTIGLYDQTNGAYRLTIGSDGHVVIAEDKKLSLHNNAFISTKIDATNAVNNNLTGYIVQDSLVLDSNQDIWVKAAGGNKVSFGTSDGATHEVMRVQYDAVGASQHGYVNLNYVTANAGQNASSALKLQTTSTGISVTGNVAATGDILISSANPKISLTDTGQNPDFDILNTNGTFQVNDTTNGAVRFQINSDGHTDCLAGLDVTGNITVSGTSTVSGDATFSGGTGAITIAANSDIRAATGTWTGESSGKIQHHSNNWYLQNAGGNWLFRNPGGTNLFTVDHSGNATATGNVTAYSDERLKTNVNTINDALSICGKLRGVSFDWKEDGKHSIGVIAQEVEEIIPEVVVTNYDKDPTTGEETDIKSVDYGKIVGVLINAINELKAEVDELKGGK